MANGLANSRDSRLSIGPKFWQHSARKNGFLILILLKTSDPFFDWRASRELNVPAGVFSRINSADYDLFVAGQSLGSSALLLLSFPVMVATTPLWR